MIASNTVMSNLNHEALCLPVRNAYLWAKIILIF
jgi:hypothetical protein